MAHMVRTVRVLSVPAGGERDDGTDAAGTHLVRQGLAVGGAAVDVAIVASSGHAAVADLASGAGALSGGIADEHAEAGLESRHLLLGVGGGDIVDGDTTVSTQTLAHELRHPLVGPVACTEVQHRRPVVREVLGEGAARARRRRGQVMRSRVHGRVERVPAHDLVQVRRRRETRVHEGVETVHDKPGALEPHHRHRLGGAVLREQR